MLATLLLSKCSPVDFKVMRQINIKKIFQMNFPDCPNIVSL